MISIGSMILYADKKVSFMPLFNSSVIWSQQKLIGDQAPLLGHFYPEGLSFIATKVTVMSLSGRFRSVQKRIEEIEEEDEEAIMQIELSDVLAPSRHKHELSIWKGFGRNLRLGLARDLAIVSVQRIVEIFGMALATSKMKKSIVKNIPRSAERKAKRYQSAGTITLIEKVAMAAFKGQICFWVALFTVNQGIDTWFSYKQAHDDNHSLQRNDTYGRRLVLNFSRCVLGCAFAAIGAAIGTRVKPGIGTTLGLNIAPQFAFILI